MSQRDQNHYLNDIVLKLESNNMNSSSQNDNLISQFHPLAVRAYQRVLDILPRHIQAVRAI